MADITTSYTAAKPVLSAASRQWAMRPNDQRFLSLEALLSFVKERLSRSYERRTRKTDALHCEATQDGDIRLHHDGRSFAFSNWSFGQLANHTGVPLSYLTDNATLVFGAAASAFALTHRLTFQKPEAQLWVHGSTEGEPIPTLAALTSLKYGRISDASVVQVVADFAARGNWKIPAASYAHTDPLRATTLYASDRDVFIFLVDESRPIDFTLPDGSKELLYRGFYVSNSETGSLKFHLSAFLYRVVCDNRNIYGARELTQLDIRHNSKAPLHFRRLAVPALSRFTEASDKPIIEEVRRLAAHQVGPQEDVLQLLAKKSFPKGLALQVADQAKTDGGGKLVFSAWDVFNAATRHAQTLNHADDRVALERRAAGLVA